ncbi:MAG TPA: hypothetical protein VKQ71_10860, partial [Acidimicrobiales bacterium]|nr:hypothetical protein [Acidimicrobiales bacterium]
VGQQHAGDRARQPPGRVDDEQTFERPRHGQPSSMWRTIAPPGEFVNEILETLLLSDSVR